VLNVGTPELLVILVVALLVLGPDKLPGAARQVGRAVGELRRLSSGFQAEIRDAMQEPVKGMLPDPESDWTPFVSGPVPTSEEAPEPAPARPRRSRPLHAPR
jgi:Tat protein translocase TatB subunit